MVRSDILPYGDTFLNNAIKHFANAHFPSKRRNVCLLSTPRSGSTWLMELILTQRGFKPCREPFDIRNPVVFRRLPLDEWDRLYDDAALPELQCYLDGFLDNTFSAAFQNLRPGNKNYRPITRRIVFQILHACEHRIHWLNDTLRAKSVFLVRHPIAVSISRRQIPRVRAFLNSDFRRLLPGDLLGYARTILKREDKLETAVLDWCLQNYVPLTEVGKSCLLVTYEQLVLQPEPVLSKLMEYLDLDSVERMHAALGTPSESTKTSDQETMSYLAGNSESLQERDWLINKWRPKVTSSKEKALMDMVDTFGIDVYREGDTTPNPRYWIGNG